MNPANPTPDQSTLNRWRQNFLDLNAQKLASAREQLSPRQQAVLDVLPLLLHCNGSRLPGYVAPHTPCGITGYTPTLEHHSALHQFARGAQIPRDPGQRCIEGVFLMGSLGSVAQSRNSDLDVWLCHDELLTDQQISDLQEKCTRIEKWADSQGTEVHFFLMNLKDFRDGQSQSADGEDCGSSQHLLLLDEFYRSALWLAGKTPRWWLTPEDLEYQADSYWTRLTDNHLIDVAEWLDVGSLPTIPAGEFVGAGLWQLNKGLSNPYKSLLKLLLNREYASAYPDIRPLAWDFRKQVQDGGADLLNTDPYLLMLRRLESHLGEEESDLRDLMRRAFYFKSGVQLTRLVGNQRQQRRVKALEEQVKEWGWTYTYLDDLDSRQSWPARKVMNERNALVTQMLNSYRALATFSQEHAQSLHIKERDLKVLGNQLFAAFRAEPGKIIDINPKIRSDMEEEKLTLNLKDGIWQLIPGSWRPGDDSAVLMQTPSIIEALVFARRNGMLTSHSHVALYPAHNPVTQYELRSLLQDIMEIPLPGKKSIDFENDQTPLRWHLFVNPGVNPQQSLSRRGMQKISNRDDALGFSSSRENLVQSVELLTITSWGEWQVSYYTGADTVHEAMLQVLNFRSKADTQAWPEWRIHCHCQVRSVAIQKRLEQLLNDLIDHLSQAKPAPYLLQTGDSFHLIEYRRREVVSHHAESLKALIKLLARPRPRFRRWQLDRHALPSSPLRLILEQSEGDEWHVWYWRQKGKVFLYVMDQFGSLHYQEQSDTDIRSTLVPVLRFIRRLNQRWADESQQPLWPLHLSELLLDGETLSFSAQRRRIPMEAKESAAIEVCAHSHAKSVLEISVNDITLSQATFGTKLLVEARQAVINARTEDHAQPVWLSDIVIDDNQHLIRHLQFRQRLEHLLNSPPTTSTPKAQPPHSKGRAQAQT